MTTRDLHRLRPRSPAADGRPRRPWRLPSRPPGGVLRRRAAHRCHRPPRCWGISLRSAAVARRARSHDFVYHVVERAPEPATPRTSCARSARCSASTSRPTTSEAALARLTDQAVTVVTITVTEHGYCAVGPVGPSTLSRPEIVHDLVHRDAPRSLPGAPARSARSPPRRRRRAVHRRILRQPAVERTGHRSGRARARRVPRPGARRVGRRQRRVPLVDGRPHGAGDHRSRPGPAAPRRASSTPGRSSPSRSRNGCSRTTFPTGRPPWERAGVELVTDVALHEQAKLRILNAAHSALAYWGLLAGHQFVWPGSRRPGAARRDARAARDESSRRSLLRPAGTCGATRSGARPLRQPGAAATPRPRSPPTDRRSCPCGWCRPIRALLAAGAATHPVRAGARGVGDLHGWPSVGTLRDRRRRSRRRRSRRARRAGAGGPEQATAALLGLRVSSSSPAAPRAPSAPRSPSRHGACGTATCAACSLPSRRSLARRHRGPRKERMNTLTRCSAPRG